MYNKMECSFCGKVNLVYFGDTEKCWKPDVTGCKCWSCKKIFPIVTEQECRDIYGNDEIDEVGGFMTWFNEYNDGGWFDGEKC